MTSEGLGEMFGGDSADTCAGKFPLMLMGDKRTVKHVQTVSEDPHRRDRKLLFKKLQMAALSAIRNRKSQKLREGFEDFLARCVERSDERNEVELEFVMDTFENLDIKIEEKELTKLDKLADKNRKMSR